MKNALGELERAYTVTMTGCSFYSPRIREGSFSETWLLKGLLR